MDARDGTTLRGRRIVVTGATGGIGTELCTLLARAGARLALTASSPARLAALVSGLARAEPAEAPIHRAADITDEAEVSAFFKEVGDRWGGADALVNLAGRADPGRIADTTAEAFHRGLDVNLAGTFLSCKHFVPLVHPGTGGLVVNVASMAAKRANPVAPLYCAAKAAVAMFSEAFALQVRERGIRVTTVNPGGVDTAFWGDRAVDRTRMLAAVDVAEVVVFVLTRPPYMSVHDISFESAGRRR
ncbi:SDR family oxidoreductase [Thermocatellispora tengchongensis]|uniref:SDR family oxidoreductase n=1 Tax=Thermocatellispora tengchongensis TaxID=1073253 RepID=UPI003642784E